MRGVWISYLEINNILKGKTRDQFTRSIREVFDNCKSLGLNTVVVQVRAFGDAIYPSEHFPWSYLCTGTEGGDPGYDPLAIMVEEAHVLNLRLEAWLNPYRVRSAGNTNAMSATNPAARFIEEENGAVISYNGTISYNPASAEARKLIVDGAVEIASNYNVDGIHIDDYFYPTTDEAFDAVSYGEYREGGGALSLGDWRRQNVETLIKELYAGIKITDQSVVFGISPQAGRDINYDKMYLDVAKIAGGAGYCDYICPQIYFGYENAAQPFLETLTEWNEMTASSPVKLYVGLAAYKVGLADEWAGGGRNEWIESDDLIMRMIESCRLLKTGGFILYRYDSLLRPEAEVAAHAQKELDNIRSVL
jgi:uncharacterized lipoprotein YddW (UPF0748 family)